MEICNFKNFDNKFVYSLLVEKIEEFWYCETGRFEIMLFWRHLKRNKRSCVKLSERFFLKWKCEMTD